MSRGGEVTDAMETQQAADCNVYVQSECEVQGDSRLKGVARVVGSDRRKLGWSKIKK